MAEEGGPIDLDASSSAEIIGFSPVDMDASSDMNYYSKDFNDTTVDYGDLSATASLSWPPLPVLALALGTLLHCPCSFLYHWKFATALPPGPSRLTHWSRRLDHSAIHMCSALWSYGTSGGSVPYLALNLMYNAESILRQFETEVRPQRNQIRVFLAMLLYTAPLPWRGEIETFVRVWCLFVVGVWLFVSYPLKGWSHAAFHVATAFVPPILLESACRTAG